MNYADQLQEIIIQEKPDQLLPFLQSLPAGNLEELRKKIKTLKKQLEKYIEIRIGNWGRKGTAGQTNVLQLAALGLLSKQDLFSSDYIVRLFNNHSQSDIWPYILEILKYRQEDWFTDCLKHHQQKNEWLIIDYQKLRELQMLGIIQHDKELFTKPMTYLLQIPWKDQQETQRDVYSLICQDDFLLKNDLLSIFEYETNLYWINHYYSKDRKQTLNWTGIFLRLVEENKINRQLILQKCLHGLKRDFNKNLLGWYKDLFNELKPTIGERITLQQGICELLHCTSTQPVNFAIEQIKHIYTHPDFDFTALSTGAESLLSRSDVRTATRTLLAIFEKSVKIRPSLAKQISLLVCNVFIIDDAIIHEKAAKLINQVGDRKDQALLEQLTLFSDQLSATARDLLQEFLPVTEEESSCIYEKQEDSIPQRITNQNKLQPINSWNDLLFQIGKVTSHLNTENLELLLDGLIRLQSAVPANFHEQVKPYLRKPEQMQWLYGMEGLINALISDWANQGKTHYVSQVNLNNTDRFLYIYQQRFEQVINKIHDKSTLPLLATPSHAPYWIAPEVLVDRMLAYQKHNTPIDYLDLAIAIARTSQEEKESALEKAEQLTGFYKELMLFFLGDTVAPTLSSKSSFLKPISDVMTKLMDKHSLRRPRKEDEQHILWAVAARTKNPSGKFDFLESTSWAAVPNVISPFALEWEMQHKNYSYKNWDKTIITIRYSVIHLQLPDKIYSPIGLLYSQHISKKEDLSYYYINEKDAELLFSLIPHYPEALYIQAIQAGTIRSELGEETERRIVSAVLRTLLSPDRPFQIASTLLLATGLLHAQNTTRGIASEVVVQAISDARLDTYLLGEMLGKLITGNYAPVQRLIGALTLVKDIAALHDSALEQILESLIIQLEGAPPKNLKKLLELYLDICKKHRRRTTTTIKEKASVWQQNATLKPVAAKIAQLISEPTAA
ncbi:DUF6493 family protein [Cytophagaceae bacterium DM2B3-1]|uniref:DUF6493 family protein n=1 Tax=Xanthocytophaga flava TaxID=3048013 RepID=A0ABT7CCN4_9BACT|nr:DUF6493 family protein [Xanthocytophaga flavus]MDJ1491395.1 DUF6493 family protein [Xanthocytophaga flavus]